MGQWVSAVAPAKVNPWLQILAKRDDGFHELVTAMLALELADVVRARANRSAEATLRLEGPFVSADIPTDASNLALRAAQDALVRARELGCDPEAGIELELEKNVPSRAGLGGASSDAAAAFLATESALGVDLGSAWRSERLAHYGSDCVFFEDAGHTGIAWCEGRGERVRALDSQVREWNVVIVTPEVECPTAAVYGALEFPLSAPPRVPNVPALFDMKASRARTWLFNHLEQAALSAVPQLAPWRELLDAEGAQHFRLSGSGSSFFGLFDTRVAAESAAQSIRSAASARGLALRGVWVTRPSGAGAKLS